MPERVIQCFINQLWRFTNVYCKGLTNTAAAWDVRKQKQHWAINQTVMMAIDILMNPAAPVAAVAEAYKGLFGNSSSSKFLATSCTSNCGKNISSPAPRLCEIAYTLHVLVRQV